MQFSLVILSRRQQSFLFVLFLLVIAFNIGRFPPIWIVALTTLFYGVLRCLTARVDKFFRNAGRCFSLHVSKKRRDGSKLDIVDMPGEKQIGHRVFLVVLCISFYMANIQSALKARFTSSFSRSLCLVFNEALACRLSRPFIPNISKIVTRLFYFSFCLHLWL